MSYIERFRSILKNTAIGFAIGLIISIIIVLLTRSSDFYMVLIFGTLFFGSAAAMVISLKKGASGFASSVISTIWSGMKTMFFSSLFRSSIFWGFGVAKLIIGLLLMIPVGLYMIISFFVNFIYTGIMALLEKLHIIREDSTIGVILDKVVAIGTIAVVVVISIAILKTF